jgi:hypothetical protein
MASKVLAAAIRSMYGTASKIFTSAAVVRLGNAFPTTRSNSIAPDTVRSPWSTSVKFPFAPIQSVSLSLALWKFVAVLRFGRVTEEAAIAVATRNRFGHQVRVAHFVWPTVQ